MTGIHYIPILGPGRIACAPISIFERGRAVHEDSFAALDRRNRRWETIRTGMNSV